MRDQMRTVAAPLLTGGRYLGVAAFCAGLHNVIMILLEAVGVHYALCLVVSTAILIPTGFFLHAAYTFTAERTWRGFWRYAGVMAVNLPGSFILLWLLYDVFGLAMWIAAPLATVLLIAWNFIAARRAIRQPVHRAGRPCAS